MNITYEILWIDDQTDAVDDDVDEISAYIDEQGFEPEIQVISPFDDIEEKLNDARWHLITMDYDLGGGHTGTKLIQKIRGVGHHTEVVFYSSDPQKVENDLKREALEGVYYASREGADLTDKIKAIIDLTLRRVMDVNTMRGIVMAEVAEMDHEMEDIIRLHHGHLDPTTQESFRRKIVTRVKKSLADNQKKVDKYLISCAIDDCLDPRFIDTSKRKRTVEQVFRDAPDAVGTQQKKALEACDATLKARNTLAHGRTIKYHGEEVVESPVGKFYLKDAIKLRRELRAQRRNFLELKDALDVHHSGTGS